MSHAVKLYLNGATIMTTPTARQIDVAVAAGFAGIEARAERLRGKENAGELEAAVKAARASGGSVLSVNGLGLQALPGGALDEEKLSADLPELLDITASLGAPLLLVVPLRAPGVAFEDALPGMREGLARAHDAAERYGIALGFEFLGFGDCPIDTPARALAVAEALPDVGFVPDSCHVYASGAGMRDFPVDRLRLVHLNDVPLPAERSIEDGDRVLPGEGRIPLERYVRELKGAGFDGPWSLETFNELLWKEDPAEVAARGYAALRSILEPDHAGERQG
jgi:2-keto-myo-inositol isomerase